MNNKFDELAMSMAQSVTRRGALKKFGLGLAGIALASMGIANSAHAEPRRKYRCHCDLADFGCDPNSSYVDCIDWCGNGLGKWQCGGRP